MLGVQGALVVREGRVRVQQAGVLELNHCFFVCLEDEIFVVLLLLRLLFHHILLFRSFAFLLLVLLQFLIANTLINFLHFLHGILLILALGLFNGLFLFNPHPYPRHQLDKICFRIAIIVHLPSFT